MLKIMKNICVFLFCLGFSFGQKMEKQLESNTPCRIDKDCTKISENSLCIDNTVDSPGVCYCYENFITQKNNTYFQCLAKIENINEVCEKDIQCQFSFGNYSFCENKKCVCMKGSHFTNNKCYKTVQLQNTCTFQQECLLKNGSLAYCLEGKCECGILEHPVHDEDGDSCEANKNLGEQCNKDTECLIENSLCVGVCLCKTGYTTSVNERSCLKIMSKLDDHCEEDSQCEPINNAVCEHFRCKCRNHFHEHRGTCLRNAKLEAYCQSDQECWMYPSLQESVYCDAGICSCRFGFDKDRKLCLNSGFSLKFNLTVILFGILGCVIENYFFSFIH